MKRVTEFAKRHAAGQSISMVTCYDAWSARLIASTDVNAVLVGDSVAMVMHGFPSTVHATTEMMATHTAAVRRGIGEQLIIADVPFPEHRKGIGAAMVCVDALMKAGANAVKVEGIDGHRDVIEQVIGSGVPVMGHLGLMPQSVNQLGGYRVQGRDDAAAQRIMDHARQLEEAGAFAIVLECVPAALAERITQLLSIPTIGIGSGPGCSGQILVLHDLLGMDPRFQPKFVRKFMDGAEQLSAALNRYHEQVVGLNFPNDSESF